jgi:nitrogen fixation/metabolism regulation signal transduction histidine kinase
MGAPVFLLLAAVLLAMTVRRVVVRPMPKGIDWALEVAFVRLDFSPPYRDVAQQIAAGLAEIVGIHIKQLKPEHNLSQIAEWAENGIFAKDLITLFVVAFDVKCDVNTTFRDLVEKVARKKTERGEGGIP